MHKLLYLTTNLKNSGGVSRVLSVKLNYLIAHYDYSIHVILTENIKDDFFYHFSDKIIFHKIETKNLGFISLLKYKQEINSIINKVKPNIIINTDNGFKGALFPYLVKSKTHLIFELHGSKDMVHNNWKDSLKYKLGNYLFRKNIKAYDAFVVLTEGHAKEWNFNNVKVINNPVTVENLYPKVYKSKVVIAVGRFSPEKGYLRLLKIWGKVSQENPNWKLKIYGEGNKKFYLNELRKLKILESVEINDATRNIEKVYSNASLLVNTSFSEAFGLSIIEAMAFGLPVIAFDTLGANQLIENDKNGYLIPQDDDAKFVNRMNTLMNNEEKLSEISCNTRKSVERYGLGSIMTQWYNLFESLIK